MVVFGDASRERVSEDVDPVRAAGNYLGPCHRVVKGEEAYPGDALTVPVGASTMQSFHLSCTAPRVRSRAAWVSGATPGVYFMAKGTGGTIYLIGLIFAIIVAFVLLGIAYYMNTQWTKVSEDLNDAKKKFDQEHEKVGQLENDKLQLNKLIN